jgi:hypothetical protein
MYFLVIETHSIQIFVVAPNIAASFSIETYPEHWIKVIGKMLMGTHNFERVGK